MIPALCDLWLVPGTNAHRVDGRAKDMFTVFWVSDPAGLRGIEDSVTILIVHSPLGIDVSGSL